MQLGALLLTISILFAGCTRGALPDPLRGKLSVSANPTPELQSSPGPNPTLSPSPTPTPLPLPSPLPLAPGLVGYWSMDNVDIDWGTRSMLDRSGNGHTAILTALSGASSTPGKFGQALRFDGTNTLIQVTGSQLLKLSLTNTFTFSAWINLPVMPFDWANIIEYRYDQLLSTYANIINFHPGGTADQFLIYNAGITKVNQWYLLTATYDGLNEAVYLNGTLLDSRPSIGVPGSSSTLKIGKGFNGLLDDVRIYNRALSPAEVQQLYQATAVDATPLRAPRAPTGLALSSRDATSVTLSWNANTDADLAAYRLFNNGSLVAVISAGTTSWQVIGLSPATSYSFELAAVSRSSLESSRSPALPVTTEALANHHNVKPEQYLAERRHPTFKSGHTLLPLTKFSWPYTYQLLVEMARWGYALDFGDADAISTGKLSDPSSTESRLVTLAHDNPSSYKLSVNIPRVTIPPEAFTVDANGNRTTVFSPEAPDSALTSMANETASYLQKVLSRAPISMVLNGGERYLGVLGQEGAAWKDDPTVMAAKGSLSWSDYQSQRKAHQEMFFHDASHALTPAPYIWYFTGNQARTDSSFWDTWDWDYKWMNTVSDYPDTSIYYKSFNTGWTGHDSNNDMLSQALNSFGIHSKYGKPLSYNWLCAGWNSTLGELDRYYGYLKSYYTAGMIGGVAGYFEYPSNGGFDPTFDSATPPHWLQQIEVLGQVHAQFSYLEDMLRNGDLLPGPHMNEVSTAQPAYEFWTGFSDTRVLARKLKGAKRWLISAWAADGVTRKVSITVPNLGTVALVARPAGSIYDARIANGVVEVTLLDPDPFYPTPVAVPASTPDLD